MRALRLIPFCLFLLAWPAGVSLGQSDPPGEQGAGQVQPLSPDLRAAGWSTFTLPGKAPVEFRSAGPERVEVRAENAVSFLYRPVAADQRAARKLSWRWRVDKAVPVTDLLAIGQDDRSLALHICFPDETENLSLLEWLGHSVQTAFSGPLSGKVLTYVWGGSQPQGSVFANPHLGRDGKPAGTIIVLRSGGEEVGRWRMEEVDFVADFKRIYGYAPPPPAYLAISSDSDDTMTKALAFVEKLNFIK